MKDNKVNNVVIVTLFLIYITVTCILTIKNNMSKFENVLETLSENEEYISLNNIDKTVKIKENLEQTFTSNVELKYDYIDLYGLVQKIMLKKVVEDADDEKMVVKLSNNNLTFIYPDKDISNWTSKITAVSDYSKEHNIYMLYVDAPWKIDENAKLPFYLKDNLPKVHKKFIKEISNNGVNVLKLENKLEGNSNDWFFKTDHHWNIQTAFNAYKLIIKNINKNVNLDLQNKYLNDYTTKTYKNIFLGTYGKRVGKYYGGIDDFQYITPNFYTNLDVTNSNWDEEISHLVGTFEKTLTYPEYLEKTEIDRDDTTYHTYTNGGKATVKINNLNAYNDKKLLVVKDSFAEPVFPFLSLNFKETRAIDVRCQRNINLLEYIKSYEPDVVLFIHTPSSLYDDVLAGFKWE